MRTLAALLVAALTLPGPTTGPTTSAPRAPASSRQVLLVSVDALNPRALTRLGPALTPNFHRLIDQGASTLNARTLYEATETLPNHTSMLTSRRAALPRGTGVLFNHDTGGTLEGTAGHYVAGVFDVVHDHGGRTAMYVAKDKFRFLNRSWDGTHGAPDTFGADDGRDKIDRFVLAPEREDLLVPKLVASLESSPRTFTFLHLAAPDRAGHEYGGMSAQYLDAVEETDALLGQVLDAVPASMVVIVTSDHGTNARTHDDPTRLANYRIPFFVWGAGVSHGGLYDLNPDFAPPGRRRPTYRGVQPIRNGDVANLVTSLLGLPRVSGSELDVPRTLGWG